MLVEKLNQENVKEWAKIIEAEVNSFSFNPKEEAKALENSNLIPALTQLSYIWIKFFGEFIPKNAAYKIDGRNKVSSYKCKILYSLVKDFPYYKTIPELSFRKIKDQEVYNTVIDMLDMHKTLQQTFSGFIFHFISMYIFDENMNALAVKELEYEFWQNNPMI